MKVISKMKNIPNKEFQQCLESRLIEVMNVNMQTIQFVPIMNLIQIKWTAVANSLSETQLMTESRPAESQQHSLQRV
jgi:hypothetical protein